MEEEKEGGGKSYKKVASKKSLFSVFSLPTISK